MPGSFWQWVYLGQCVVKVVMQQTPKNIRLKVEIKINETCFTIHQHGYGVFRIWAG